MAQLTLLNRLGSDTEIAQSVLGVNGTKVGTPTYGTGKWGNGNTVGTGNITTNYNYFVLSGADYGNMLGPYSFGFYMKLNYNVVNGVPDGSNNYNCPLSICDPTNSTPTYFSMDFNKDTNARCEMYVNTKYKGNIQPNFTNGTWYHMGFCINDAGIAGGSDRVRWYINGTLFYNSDMGGAGTGTSGNVRVIIGHHFTSEYGVDGCIDNLTIWKGEKTDWNDCLNNERAGLNDMAIIL